ncbi:MAG TPA: ADOP family duplicated permease, partial [Bryobacteraceae bacterium]|nr:ADOP family duplicated permease [Bryobacteraceae bacterium]
EQAFDLWRFNALENLWRDLRFAVRDLARSRAFVLTALVSLGLGIGLNTAIFSLAMELLFSQPSVRDVQSLAYIRQGGNSHMQPSVVDELRRSGMFEDVAGETEDSFINYDNGSETRQIYALEATKNFFTLLGAPTALGRGWTEQDPDDVVVLNAPFWRAKLGARPDILGKTIRLDGRLYTVLGVLPDDYRTLIGYGYAPDVLIPRYRQDTMLAAYARLKPGMSLGQLKAALPALGARLNREFPPGNELNNHLQATPPNTRMGNEDLTVDLFFAVLLLAVGLVLLIACINVANLFLARASVRRQEISIRLALGASRARLLQQLLAESLLLSLAGAVLGFGIALAAARAAAAIPMPFPAPIRLHISPDWRVAAYAAFLALLSAVACGLAPAWQAVRESLSAGMKRQRGMRMRRSLVVVQIAVSFVVLVTAALFVHNLLRGSALSPGFDVRRTIRAEVFLPPAAYRESQSVNAYANRAVNALRSIPGVEFAAAARTIPFTDSSKYGSMLQFSDTGERRQAFFAWNAVTPDYFRAMSIPVLRGRAFTSRDRGSAMAVVVNDVFVKQYLGARDPVGATFVWTAAKIPYTIVGVVRATKTMTIGEDPRPQLYEPLAQIQNSQTRLQFVVRAATLPAAQLTAVRKALRAVEPEAGIQVETMFSAIDFAFLPSQIGAALMGSVGALALILAIAGLYGILAFSVARRTREIGIRMAVGAAPRDVTRMVLSELARLLALGTAAGFLVSAFVTRPLSLFFVPGMTAADPSSYAAVIAVLAATGALAALGPLRRALRVDPLRSLRYE